MPVAHLKVPTEVRNLIRHLPRVLKRNVRAALAGILDDPTCGKALKEELACKLTGRTSTFREFSKRRKVHKHKTHGTLCAAPPNSAEVGRDLWLNPSSNRSNRSTASLRSRRLGGSIMASTTERPLTDALTAIRTRRSVKEYVPTEIPREWIEELLDAAHWAPNHKN
jgi:hypothetical protein